MPKSKKHNKYHLPRPVIAIWGFTMLFLLMFAITYGLAFRSGAKWHDLTLQKFSSYGTFEIVVPPVHTELESWVDFDEVKPATMPVASIDTNIKPGPEWEEKVREYLEYQRYLYKQYVLQKFPSLGTMHFNVNLSFKVPTAYDYIIGVVPYIQMSFDLPEYQLDKVQKELSKMKDLLMLRIDKTDRFLVPNEIYTGTATKKPEKFRVYKVRVTAFFTNNITPLSLVRPGFLTQTGNLIFYRTPGVYGTIEKTISLDFYNDAAYQYFRTLLLMGNKTTKYNIGIMYVVWIDESKEPLYISPLINLQYQGIVELEK